MTAPWYLPREALLAGKPYRHRTDFRTVLELLEILNEEREKPMLRWLRAVGRFYEDPVPYSVCREAMDYMADFITMGQREVPGVPVLLDWKEDAQEILEGVNAVAGRDIREDAHVHWWTFLSWYHNIGQGRLSTLVSIRQKRLRGEKLTEAEQEFVRCFPNKFRPKETEEDRKQKEKLEALLSGNVNAAEARPPAKHPSS